MNTYFSFWIPSIPYWVSSSYFEDNLAEPLNEKFGRILSSNKQKGHVLCTIKVGEYTLECHFFQCGIVSFNFVNIGSDVDVENEGISLARKMLKTIKNAIGHNDVSDFKFNPVVVREERRIVKGPIDGLLKQLIHYSYLSNTRQQECASDLAALASGENVGELISEYDIVSNRKSVIPKRFRELFKRILSYLPKHPILQEQILRFSRVLKNPLKKHTKLRYLLITNDIAAELHKNELRTLNNIKACNFIRASVSSTRCDECTFDDENYFKSFVDRLEYIKDLNESILQESTTIRELINYFSHISTVTVATILAVIIPVIFGIMLIADDLSRPNKHYFVIISLSFLAYLSYYAIFGMLESSIKKHFRSFK